jgi:hypothetical protein
MGCELVICFRRELNQFNRWLGAFAGGGHFTD